MVTCEYRGERKDPKGVSKPPGRWTSNFSGGAEANDRLNTLLGFDIVSANLTTLLARASRDFTCFEARNLRRPSQGKHQRTRSD